jgi:hypothetical protein
VFLVGGGCSRGGGGRGGAPLAHIKHEKRTNFPLEFLFDLLVIGAWVVDSGYTVILQSSGGAELSTISVGIGKHKNF